jgi:hypothetical protein
VSDIFKYKASLTIQHNRSDEIAKRLPLVFQQRLHDVVARDIEVKSSLVTFHGGASRTATTRHRLVTNWNLLSGISRGTIQVENNYSNFTVSFWVGFPKSTLLLFALLIVGMSMVAAVVIFLQGESLLEILLGAVLPIMVLGCFALGIGLTTSILRFHWFVRNCINQTKREVEKQLSP